ASAWSLWLVWWTGDAVGVMVVTPFLLVWTTPEPPPPAMRLRWAEGGVLFLALAIATDYLFSHAGVLVFAVYPLAILIAWRLGPRAATTATVVVTLIASWRTLSGVGPFTSFTPTENLFALQFFLSLLAVKNLAFAASRAETAYTEARLKTSEARYRMLAQNLPDGCVVLFARDTRLLLVDGPAIAGAGFVKEEVEGRRLSEIFDPAHADRLTEAFTAAFDGREIEFEFGYLEKLYLVRVLPVEDPDGQRIGMALALDITERDRAQRTVAESRAQLEQLSRLLLTAQEDERRRVAREVHDELGQALTAVKIGLAQTMARAKRRNSLESERRAQGAADTLDRAIESVQRIVLRLRPGVLDNLGPLAALEHEVQQFREQSRLEVSLSLPPEPLAIDPDHSTVLYRTVQEALTNVLRHAQATRVSVTLLALDADFVLQVADDGIGIAEEQLRKPRSMGLLGMRERAAACGGRVDIARMDTGGTCVMLRIPRRLTGRTTS
ncbi:MAG TPA: MASE1 domain-containing protein, partial [Gemmatimonadaceae bacterium]|nr:MASE1 domain-containing protein [Gemmatimonadaceae bacterium]